MMPMFDLQRFVDAQEPVYQRVIAELQRGRKTSHWMWFVFPQLVGLGRSADARRFGISGLAEAREYLQHPVLGPRLRECAGLVLAVTGRSAVDIFGTIDAVKLRSSATLFAQVSEAHSVFHRILDQYYRGMPDDLTLALLEQAKRQDAR